MKEKIAREIKKIAERRDFRANPCFYLYDLDNISQKASILESNLPENVNVYYAIKANPNTEILTHIRSIHFIRGLEIASSGELELALNFYKPREVIYTGPGKTPFELQQSVNHGIRHINLESYVEALRLSSLVLKRDAPKQDVLVRINVDHSLNAAHTHMSGLSSKLGIDEARAYEEIQRITQLNGLNARGIHVFSCSGLIDYRDIIDSFRHIFELARKLERRGIQIDCIDLGGGFGIDYSGDGRSLDLPSLGEGLRELVDRYDCSRRELILELGRYIVGESGYYVSEIVDIKESRGKKHIIAAGGINHQRRPCAVEKNHPVEIVPMNRPALYDKQPLVHNEVANIDGPLCLNDDILAKEVLIKHARIGDLVVVRQSGAYGLSMAAVNFLKHPLPKEYVR